MTARAELYRLVDQLDDTEIPEALEYLRSLAALVRTSAGVDKADESDHDPSDSVGYANVGRPTDENDSLWNIVGLGRTAAPTDIRHHKDDYLADAYSPESR
jgi:hypothetical protein